MYVRSAVYSWHCDGLAGRFSTTTPGFVYSDQYIQLTTELASEHVYGLGEHNHRRLKHDMNWKKWTIFTRDVAPVVRRLPVRDKFHLHYLTP